jgi:hypothetical protein
MRDREENEDGERNSARKRGRPRKSVPPVSGSLLEASPWTLELVTEIADDHDVDPTALSEALGAYWLAVLCDEPESTLAARKHLCAIRAACSTDDAATAIILWRSAPELLACEFDTANHLAEKMTLRGRPHASTGEVFERLCRLAPVVEIPRGKGGRPSEKARNQLFARVCVLCDTSLQAADAEQDELGVRKLAVRASAELVMKSLRIALPVDTKRAAGNFR